MSNPLRNGTIRSLYKGLHLRQSPEEVAVQVAELLKLTPDEVRKFPRRSPYYERYGSSMSTEWDRAKPIGRPIASLASILGADAPDGKDVAAVTSLVAVARERLGIAADGGTSFKHDRMNRAQRRVTSHSTVLANMSRRQYDKLFRLVGRIEARMGTYAKNSELADLAEFAKVGFAAEVPWHHFRRSSASAAFVAYYVANAGRRSLFTINPQKKAMDAALKVLLDRCERSKSTSWLAVAYCFPREDVLARLTPVERADLMEAALQKMSRLADLLAGCVTSTMDLENMVVSRGDDSSTWNALAGAWNKARDMWIATAWSLDPSVADAFLPGKVLRLMAADVAAWHRISGGGLDPNTLVWRDVPRPWEVMRGERSCTRELVAAACVVNHVDPEKTGWVKPRPRLAVDTVAPTPETVHGVVVSHPLIATILRKAGWFSGYEKRVRELPDELVAAGVAARQEHHDAQDALRAETVEDLEGLDVELPEPDPVTAGSR